MKYNAFIEQDNTVYCFGHPIESDLQKMLSPTDYFTKKTHFYMHAYRKCQEMTKMPSHHSHTFILCIFLLSPHFDVNVNNLFSNPYQTH
jgi:hypothetical protein